MALGVEPSRYRVAAWAVLTRLTWADDVSASISLSYVSSKNVWKLRLSSSITGRSTGGLASVGVAIVYLVIRITGQKFDTGCEREMRKAAGMEVRLESAVEVSRRIPHVLVQEIGFSVICLVNVFLICVRLLDLRSARPSNPRCM